MTQIQTSCLPAGPATTPRAVEETGCLDFTVMGHAEPQGSKSAYVIPNLNRAVVVDTNARKLKPYRQEVTRTAMSQVRLRPWAAKHVPVRLRLDFFILRPQSCPKSRKYPSVKPDTDKLVRSTCDALTGVLYADDAQIVQLVATKNYGEVEKVRIRVELLG